ncbi:MAG: cyclic nucleotide-binding domain-containing protein [Anaerolineales bacterium]|nr:cyclic nucleotide-binding domain-containing protein [Anaerolineales bacterium]
MTQNTISLRILLQAFPGMPAIEARELITTGRVNTYPAGTVLCHEDTFESVFYIILDGEVKVTKVIEHDQVRDLKKLGAGDFFGEMAIIHNAPRAATVTTTKPTAVLEIYKENFNSLLKRSASVARAMVQEVSRRLRENDAMAIEDLRLKAGELAAAYQQLAEQDYARREFLTTIAHELRTPLTAASGFLHMIQFGLLQGNSLDAETQKAALESVSRNVQQIVTLVNDILFLQEMDLILPNFTPTDLGTVILTVLDAHRKKAEENQVVLDIEIDPHIPMVLGDVKSLERAFSAILDNAIKFSPDGGKVFIILSHDDKHVWVTIHDHGVGIPADLLPRIFDRFFHIDEMEGHLFRGLGLGLSIARQVIEQHHGRINVESQVGKGTRLTVYLNIYQQNQ